MNRKYSTTYKCTCCGGDAVTTNGGRLWSCANCELHIDSSNISDDVKSDYQFEQKKERNAQRKAERLKSDIEQEKQDADGFLAGGLAFLFTWAIMTIVVIWGWILLAQIASNNPNREPTGGWINYFSGTTFGLVLAISLVLTFVLYVIRYVRIKKEPCYKEKKWAPYIGAGINILIKSLNIKMGLNKNPSTKKVWLLFTIRLIMTLPMAVVLFPPAWLTFFFGDVSTWSTAQFCGLYAGLTVAVTAIAFIQALLKHKFYSKEKAL